MSKVLPVVLGWAILAWAPAHAQELAENVQLHGFVSQGASHTSDNNFGGRSDDGVGLDLRELGVNLSWRPTPDWLISGQALARWAGQSDEGDLRLDYGFVDRTLFADGDNQLGVRLGKVKNPIGFYNTTRDVAHTRPGIIMPQSIYLDRIRDFFLAAPGVSLYGNSANPLGSLSWQVSALRPEVDDEDLKRFFLLKNPFSQKDWPGEFEGKDSWLGQITLDSADGQWRGGLTLGEFRMHYKPKGSFLPPPPADLLDGNHNLPIWVLSLEHNTADWSLTAEYSQTTVKAKDYFPSFLPNKFEDNTTEAWYVQATRRLGNGWQAFLRYDVLYLDRDDKDGNAFASDKTAASLGLPAHSRYAKDWVIGVRKDIDRLALSAEYHWVDGTAWLAQADNPDQPSLVKSWDMLLLQAAWRF